VENSVSPALTAELWHVSAVRFGAGHGVVLALTAVVAALGLDGPAAFVAFGVVTVAWSMRLPLGAASALALTSWAYLTGFAENRYGELTFHPGDLLRLALLLGAAAAAHWSR
jgi:hypothetical protein